MDKNIKFDLNDITIKPIIESNINSRAECNPFINFNGKQFFPIFSAPMDTIIDKNNIELFIENKIIPIVPRNKYLPIILKNKLKPYFFQSFSLAQIQQQLNSCEKNINDFYTFNNILIDIANGHMRVLSDIIKLIKTKFPYITIMVGNIANPYTLKTLSLAGADYIRLGIGTGSVCLTSANLGINYPIGSLIKECKHIKEENNLNVNIIIDGGLKNYSDIIKSLSLGADFAMVGSLFNKCLESCGDTYLWKFKINKKIQRFLYNKGFIMNKYYRGMSTKQVQKIWGNKKLITSEGIHKYNKVCYTLEKWVDNFKDYLKSAMSYSGSNDINNFKNESEHVFITEQSYKRFNK